MESLGILLQLGPDRSGLFLAELMTLFRRPVPGFALDPIESAELGDEDDGPAVPLPERTAELSSGMGLIKTTA